MYHEASGTLLVGLHWVLQVVTECLPVAIGSVIFILINIHAILQGQGRCFLEESYSYLVSTVE
jgi:hypothetical protein